MPVANITIQSLEDAAQGKHGVIPGNEAHLIREVPMKIQILEKGTVGGQTTISFVNTGEDGKHYIGQMTANQFEMLIGAFRGAVERFGK